MGAFEKNRCEVRRSGKPCRRLAAFEHKIVSRDGKTGISLVHVFHACERCSPEVDAHAYAIDRCLRKAGLL